MKNLEIFNTNVKDLFPEKLFLSTSNGNFELKLCDVEKTFPSIQSSYQHSTPIETGDSLTDGEPDYLGMDIHFIEEGEMLKLNVDITYGDAMMFSFVLKPENEVKVGHYNGFGSKADPNYEFFFQEDSITDLLNLFQSLNSQLKSQRSNFNFLDGNKESFKMEKVRFISDFKTFNLLNRP